MSVELTETQQQRFYQLMNDAKILYPNIPENMLDVPIKFYILTGEDDECFKKLEESRNETESIEEIKNIVI
jgi:hypothetical protein